MRKTNTTYNCRSLSFYRAVRHFPPAKSGVTFLVGENNKKFIEVKAVFLFSFESSIVSSEIQNTSLHQGCEICSADMTTVWTESQDYYSSEVVRTFIIMQCRPGDRVCATLNYIKNLTFGKYCRRKSYSQISTDVALVVTNAAHLTRILRSNNPHDDLRTLKIILIVVSIVLEVSIVTIYIFCFYSKMGHFLMKC